MNEHKVPDGKTGDNRQGQGSANDKETMRYFVPPGSIVRSIWGKADTILFIFAGAAAEFALNKAVDWLYFTGRLPADPIGRLFSTVAYARQIIFSDEASAYAAIERIRMIHSAVEDSRGYAIPDWAYRDVLYMLIHYSQAAFELLERPLMAAEKEELFRIFRKMGLRMGIGGLPADYTAWRAAYEEQLRNNLQYSRYTADLYKQYRKHLGPFRYFILLKVQSRLLSPVPRNLLQMKPSLLLRLALPLYKWACKLSLGPLVRALLVPRVYSRQVKQLDVSRQAL